MPTRGNSFTFVEVTVAIAILSFILVVVIGLMAIGLSSEKTSSEDTRLAAYASFAIATEKTNAFATVTQAGYTNHYYFDALGNATNSNPTAAFYVACTVSPVISAGTTAGLNNYMLLTNAYVNTATSTNLVPMRAVFTYPRMAPSAAQRTTIFYFNRANE